MATRFVNDKECTDQNIDPSYLMEWQVFIVNSQSSPQLLIAGKGDTLPPLTIITENKDILFTCNRTFRRLNKAIFIHWGDQRLFDVDYAYMHGWVQFPFNSHSQSSNFSIKDLSPIRSPSSLKIKDLSPIPSPFHGN